MNQSEAEFYQETALRAVNDFEPHALDHLDRYARSLVMTVRWEFAMLMLRLAVKMNSKAA